MKYYIKRELNEYGPYTISDLQRYVAQGNISPNDLARSEGLTDWVPVSQVLGNIAAPPPPATPPAAAGTVYAGAPAAAGTVYAGSAVQPVPVQAVGTQAVAGPIPPDLHWALVLVIGFFCSIFQIVWLFIEAGFVKKLRPQSNFLVFLIAGVAGEVLGVIVIYGGAIAAAVSGSNEPPVVPLALGGIVFIAAIVLWIMGIFKMRDAIQEYYNSVEPINLRLSGVMTFFFNVLYFQYHFTRIAEWKKTGVLAPQG